MAFGLFPGEQLTPQNPPRGYASAVVRAGELEETVFCSLEVWSLDEYATHWREAARLALEGAPIALFCTDLTSENATLLAAFPEDRGWTVEQWIVMRRCLILDGHNLVLRSKKPARYENASSWHIVRADIEALLRSGPSTG